MNPKDPENRPGRFELGRWSDDFFRLRVEDTASGLTVFEAMIDPASLALAMGGRGSMPIQFVETRDAVKPRVGKFHTIRTVMLERDMIPAVPGYVRNSEDPEAVAKVEDFRDKVQTLALVKMEAADGDAYMTGWSLSDDGSRSQQNTAGFHKVSMVRWDVERPAQAPDGVWPTLGPKDDGNRPKKRR